MEILLFILLVRDRMAVEFIATHIQSAPNVFELNMRSIQRYTDKVLGDLSFFWVYRFTDHQNYLLKRPRCSSKDLFIHFNHMPLTRYQFTSVLKKALNFLNIQKKAISGPTVLE